MSAESVSGSAKPAAVVSPQGPSIAPLLPPTAQKAQAVGLSSPAITSEVKPSHDSALATMHARQESKINECLKKILDRVAQENASLHTFDLAKLVAEAKEMKMFSDAHAPVKTCLVEWFEVLADKKKIELQFFADPRLKDLDAFLMLFAGYQVNNEALHKFFGRLGKFFADIEGDRHECFRALERIKNLQSAMAAANQTSPAPPVLQLAQGVDFKNLVSILKGYPS